MLIQRKPIKFQCIECMYPTMPWQEALSKEQIVMCIVCKVTQIVHVNGHDSISTTRIFKKGEGHVSNISLIQKIRYWFKWNVWCKWK